MPQRKLKGFTIDCEEVQGEGAYAKFKRPSWLDIRQASDQEGEDRSTALEALKALLIEWNWVDDDGEPLPLPSEDPDVFDRMPWQEVNFLITELNNINQEDEKN
jgi:hypothetical protein